MTTPDNLRALIKAKREQWKNTQDEYMRPAYEEAGNHLRTLQNSGMSISQLANYWGTLDRGTVYRLLKYATIPPNTSTSTSTKKRPKEPSETKNLLGFLVQETPTKPDHIKVRTVAPVPPEAWPQNNTTNYEWPEEPWEGEAEWDENGLLVTSQGMPLHAAQKALGGIETLLAGMSE